ncbi:outer membrane surface antigen [Paraburkholderia sp. BL18I3N2]|uniref:RT0821/Lpp0805 family surface protein n=1 Tax=Paraburkholderia sp. BL18I3N2 TaxID=1938799 RepID=UPI000D07AB64|nr:RT0821/Lpp0805 family surface protein [Paraburkholderia sp. BL18I3N2]PRX30944.1 outer membrane surface antigen [Paraburkholderia sp. BL18I3N2]
MEAHSHIAVHLFARRFAAAVLLAGATFSHAANLNFLKDTPVSFMKDADRKALNDAAQTALETKKDGESMEWNNMGTGNSVSIRGTVTPHDTSKEGDRTCRTTTLVAIAKGQTQSWTPTVCKQGSGPWTILRQ